MRVLASLLRRIVRVPHVAVAAPARDEAPRPHPAQPPAAPHDRIARRAYEVWRARGAGDGHALDDWLTAEAQVREELAHR